MSKYTKLFMNYENDKIIAQGVVIKRKKNHKNSAHLLYVRKSQKMICELMFLDI